MPAVGSGGRDQAVEQRCSDARTAGQVADGRLTRLGSRGSGRRTRARTLHRLDRRSAAAQPGISRFGFARRRKNLTSAAAFGRRRFSMHHFGLAVAAALMLDHDDSAIRRHVRVFPLAGDVRPYRPHHAAMTDDHDLVVGIFFRNVIEHRPDTFEDILVTLAVGRAPDPRTLRIESWIVGDRFVRLAGKVAEALLAKLRLVLDWNRQFRGDYESRLAGARIRTRNHAYRMKLNFDFLRRFHRLASAEVGDFRLARRGEAPNRIALALAVTNHYQLAHKVKIFSEK